MGLKTAILRVSKKWEGGEEGAFVTANCSRRLETIVSIFLFYLTETVFEWIEVWCLKILVVSKFQEINRMVYIDYSSSLIIIVSMQRRKKVCCYYAEQENSHYFIYAEGEIIPSNNFCPAF